MNEVKAATLYFSIYCLLDDFMLTR